MGEKYFNWLACNGNRLRIVLQVPRFLRPQLGPFRGLAFEIAAVNMPLAPVAVRRGTL